MTALARTAPRSATASTSSSSPVSLRLGARSPLVARLQQLLVRHGQRPGAIDGFFGPRTLAAVKAFQRAHGLKVDGWVGPLTWAALQRTPAAPPPTASRTVPFLSQLSVPNGYGHYACGPTSLAMVMSALGRPPPSVLQVALRAGTQRSAAGTSHEGLARAARSYGFTPRPGGGWNQLVQTLASGRPVVAHVTTAPLSNRPYGYRGGHYVVVTGLVRDAQGRITHVVCNDPATSFASKGQGIRYSFREFEQAWSAKNRWFLSLA